MKQIISFILIVFLISCSKEQFNQVVVRPTGCDSVYFTFEKEVRPVFNSNCNFLECHASGGRGSYDFTDYFIVANRVRAGTIDYRIDLPIDDPQHMPEHMRLSPCDYYIIKTWIRQGFADK